MLRSVWGRTKLALVLMIALAQGCGGSQTRPEASGPPPPTAPSQPPGGGFAIDSPQTVLAKVPPRGASYSEADLTRDAGQFDTELPHNRVIKAGTYATFYPGMAATGGQLSDIAYCHYIFNLSGYDRDASLRLTWDTPPAAGNLWLGVGDVVADHWNWYNGDPTLFTFADLAKYTQVDGQFTLVLVLMGDQPAVLSGLRVGSLPPVAALTATPSTATSPVLVSFDASASSDPDGAIVKYEWDFKGTGTYVLDSGADPTVQRTYNRAGVFHATVRVTDDAGITATANFDVTVLAPPVADIQATPASGFNPLDVTFDGSASTGGAGSIIKYEWDFDGDGTFDQDTGTTSSASHTYTVFGGYSATLRVTNSLGATATEAAPVSVNESWMLPPVADLQANPALGNAPLTVDFDASGSSDPDGSITKFEFDLDGDGDFELDNGLVPTAQHIYNEPGDYTTSVRVTDNVGATDSKTLSVHANFPPVADLKAPQTFGDAPFSVDFDASGSTDQDGSIVKYEFDWDGDGNYDFDAGANPQQSHTYSDPGKHLCLVRVTDNSGGTASTGLQTDANAPPTTTLSGQPSPCDAPHIISFNSDAREPGGTIVKYEYDWTNDGTYDYTSIYGSAAHTYATGGTYTCKQRVTDDDGETATATATVTLVRVIVWDRADILTHSATSAGHDLEMVVLDGGPMIGFNSDYFNDNFRIGLTDNGSYWDANHWFNYEVGHLVGNGSDMEFSIAALRYGSVLIPPKAVATWVIPRGAAIQSSQDGLWYGRALVSRPSALTDWAVHKVETGDNQNNYRGQNPSMAAVGPLLSQRPMISYYNSANGGDLRLARAKVAAPTSASDWVLMNVDTTGDVGRWNSLANVNGKPAITYYDATNSDLRYARATRVDPDSGDWVKYTMGLVGGRSSLQQINGVPMVAWYDSTENQLEFARGKVAEPSSLSDWVYITIAGSGGQPIVGGDYPVLTTLEGRPLIFFYVPGSIKHYLYAWATSASPATAADWIVRTTPADYLPTVPAEIAAGVTGSTALLAYYRYIPGADPPRSTVNLLYGHAP